MATDKNLIKKITELVKIYSEEYLCDDYYKVTKKLIDKLKKNKEFSMDKGKIEGWVAGLLYIVGEDSNLFDQKNFYSGTKMYIPKVDLAGIVDVSVPTMKKRAKDIREALPKNAKFVADISCDYDFFCDDCYDEDYDEGHEPTIDELLSIMGGMLNDVSKPRKMEEYERYLVAAQVADDIDEAIEHIKMALMHAKKKIPKNVFKQLEGQLWLEYDARPYLSIKADLAHLYFLKEDYQAAVEIYSEILKLNTNDNQGIRYKIFPLLILLNQNEKIESLVEAFDMDNTAQMLYSKALYYYKNKIEFNAKASLREAFRANGHVAEYFLGMAPFELDLPDMYALGSEEEALVYMNYALCAWAETEGALYWMIDEYFAYAKKEGIKLVCSNKEAKKFVDDAMKTLREM